MTRTLRQAAADLRSAGGGGLLTAIRRALLPVALGAEGRAKGNATSSPAVRSGALRRSIVGGVDTSGSLASIYVEAGGGVADSYAAAQEYGATIRPRASKYLAIPVGAARTASGVARYRSPRDVPGLVFLPRPGGGILLWPGKRGRGQVLFVLRRQVTIRAHRYLGRAIEDTRSQLSQATLDALRGVLGG